MTGYWWGVATVLGLAYVGFGVYLAVDGVRFSRPSQLRHKRSKFA